MSLSTFSDLKTSIANHLDRDDLTSEIPDFISLVEATHKRSTDKGGIRIKEQITRASITVDSRQIAFPSGLLETLTFRLLTNPVTNLKYVNYHEMNRLRQETSGKPKFFTIGSEFEFDRSPDSSYSGEIVYYKPETALSDSNTSNNILAADPACYLYGALIASAPFLMDDPRLIVWKALYQEAADGLNGLTKRIRRPSHVVSRPAGDTP